MSSFGPAGQPSGYEAWQDGPSEQPKLSILALASLIFSILCLTAPIGLILGIAAIFTIAASSGRKTGRGLAIAGVVIGLLFTSLLVATLVGANIAAKGFTQAIAAPVGTFMQDLESNNFTKLRTSFTPAAQTNVTDADLTAFKDAYIASMGKFKKTPQSMGEIFSGYMTSGPSIQTIQQTTAGKVIVLPVSIEFDNGWGTVAIMLPPTGQNQPGAPGSIENVAIIASGGKIIWLKDPTALPAGGSPPSLPPTPTPAPPKKLEPEAPKGGDGK